MVAAPSFGGRLPQLFAKRLQTLRGNGARAVPVVVYGNRAYEDTLLELSDLLTAAGFACCAGVAAVAEHSIFRQFAAGRPDTEDCAALLRFGKEIQQKLQGGDANPLEFPGNRPYKPLKDNPMKSLNPSITYYVISPIKLSDMLSLIVLEYSFTLNAYCRDRGLAMA